MHVVYGAVVHSCLGCAWKVHIYTPNYFYACGRHVRVHAMFMQAGLAVHAALVPAQLSSSWGGAPILRDHSGADPHIWARWEWGMG